MLDELVARKYFCWSAVGDDIAEGLRSDSNYKAKIMEKLGVESFAAVGTAFFCSQFVKKILEEIHLLEVKELDRNITPCGLYDRLFAEGWCDVTGTDYSDDAIKQWSPLSKSWWEDRYHEALFEIKLKRNTMFTNAAIDIFTDFFAETKRNLEDIKDRVLKGSSNTAKHRGSG